MSVLQVGLVGLGKIARDQHLPAMARTPDEIRLAAIASRNASDPDLPCFSTIDEMLSGAPMLDAVSLCQPPQSRFEAAWAALSHGKHVFLEKPPGASVSEVHALAELAARKGVTLFASWHSRYAAGVGRAKEWLQTRQICKVQINWKEDVRYWHPGQDWIWRAGGFGVFDPGINALSILTEIVPEAVFVREALLETPEGRAAPIAAHVRMQTELGAPIDAVFDFRQTGPQSWDIIVDTDDGSLTLSEGGAKLAINGAPQSVTENLEYPGLYRRFIDLVTSGRSDVDVSPLQLVADAFMLGEVRVVERFDD